MGYTVVITRRESPWDESGPAITQAEWAQYTDNDPEMRLDGFVEATSPTGMTVRVTDPGIAVWAAHPSVPKGVSFRLDARGNVALANPDEASFRKAWAVAQALNGRIVGEEGETYGPDGQPIHGRPGPTGQ